MELSKIEKAKKLWQELYALPDGEGQKELLEFSKSLLRLSAQEKEEFKHWFANFVEKDDKCTILSDRGPF